MKRKHFNHVYNFNDKIRCIDNYNGYMLCRTNEMFRYRNIPDTIPARMLELMLQQNGHVLIAEHEGNLYAFTGSLGGELDAYYQPTTYVVSNPYLKLSKEYVINEDAVLINNDALRLGLLPLNKKYASLLTENDISMRIYDINARINNILSAQDDRTRNSALSYLNDLENGKLGVISETALLDGIKAITNNAQRGSMTELIEYEQYLKASWFNELGLQSNYNMKRESINSNEAQLNEDALLPYIDNMLKERQEGIERVNAMFGTNIVVELASSWEDNQEELELAHEMQEAAAESVLEPEEPEEAPPEENEEVENEEN